MDLIEFRKIGGETSMLDGIPMVSNGKKQYRQRITKKVEHRFRPIGWIDTPGDSGVDPRRVLGPFNPIFVTEEWTDWKDMP